MSRAFFAAAAIAIAAPAYAEARFFAAIEDLPMPPGFAETGAASAFDGAEGRLVVAYAEGEASGLEVRDFYYETLPQLGWAVSPRNDGVLMFQRGRERLTFTLDQEGRRTRLGVRLAILRAPGGN